MFFLLGSSALSIVGLLVFGLILGAGYPLWQQYKANQTRKSYEGTNPHGSARWMNRDELTPYLDQGLLLGKAVGAFVRYPGEAHLITFAPTGTGKGVGSVIPNLLSYEGSVLCIDPKGENAAITARYRREMGHAVHVLDPWGISGQPSASFNPLSILTPDSPDLAEDALSLADALVVRSPGSKEPYWDDEASAYIAGLLLYLTCHEPDKLTLTRMRELLTLPVGDFETLMETMAASTAANGLVARAAHRMMQKAEKEMAGVISSAQNHTHFLDSGRIQAVLQPGALDLADLKRHATTVYVVLPAERMQSFNRWLRLMVSQAIGAAARERTRVPLPVLLLLDEFAALGHMQSVETAMGLMRGYGIKLWPILQDLPQLQAHYPHTWGSFIANAGALQAFGVNDPTTAEFLSKLLGSATIGTISTSWSEQVSDTFSTTGRSLLNPDEVMKLDPTTELILFQGQYPLHAEKLRYFQDPLFAGRFDPNPTR